MSRPLPLVGDNRAFTNYVSSCIYEAEMANKAGLLDPRAYREYLIKNAELIMHDMHNEGSNALWGRGSQPRLMAPHW